MPNGFDNQFDGEKFNSMMNTVLQSGGTDLQSYISNVLRQSFISFMSSAYAPPPEKPVQTVQKQPDMEQIIMQMLQMMLFPKNTK